MADAKQGKTSEDFYNGSSQSRVVLAKPRLGGFGSSSVASSSGKSCNPFGSVLRPPQLKPSANPFLKVSDNVLEETEPNLNKDNETKPSEDRLKDTKEDAEAPKFVPLGSANVTPRTSNQVPAPSQPTTSASSSGFVFGQNLSQRVIMNEVVNNGEAGGDDHSSSNGTTELLFTSAAASVKENNQEEPGPSELSGGEGLAAAAAEYERSHARPPPPTSNCTMTGEEGEINVLQISCRLFAWEAGSWRERGRGVLRLNDAAGGGGAARLVARVAGSLRVVLNTKLWPDMVVERAGTKSLRITAADAHQQLKLFLIMGAPGDIVHLHTALTARIACSKRSVNTCKQNSTSQKAAERLEAATDENDFLDKPVSDTYNNDDDISYDDEQQTSADGDANKEEQNDLAKSNRLDVDNDEKTDEENTLLNTESNESNEDKESKAIKRKEPIEDETASKRQCPEILID
ncbi:uncharacterized protein RanBP3 [Epargyreus clarus]|uniref:uncharacterized protein RanBP3 n=1 Tax=Epargyreus clarus TaxID=520877 RepID=UPI003C2CC224